MSDEDAREWWAKRRKTYNVGLVVAGIVAFLCYLVAFELRCTNSPEAEITIFTTFFQGIGYLIAMAVANLFYNLGYMSERFLKPADAGRYRSIAYWAGYGLSVALPFAVPAAVLINGCTPYP